MTTFDFARYGQDITTRMRNVCQQGGEEKTFLPVFYGASAEAESLLTEQPCGDRALIDCASGCGSCCVVNVSTLIPEGVAIARYLLQKDDAERLEIAEKLEVLWREVRGLDDEERMLMRRNCAFLDDKGLCRIYPVRPLLCRSISSTSAARCREALARKVFGEDVPIMMHQFQQQLYETIFTGVAGGLEAGGLDGRSFPVTGLVRYILSDPERIDSLWGGHRLSWQELY